MTFDSKELYEYDSGERQREREDSRSRNLQKGNPMKKKTTRLINMPDVQQRQVAWYRRHGKHPKKRIVRDSTGAEYVIGDWSWNRNYGGHLYEVIEGPMDADLLRQYEAMNIEEEIEIALGKIWKVRLTGDVVQIIDDQGRERHRSRGHMTTAVHLAFRLADMPFDSTSNMDEALRRMASRVDSDGSSN